MCEEIAIWKCLGCGIEIKASFDIVPRYIEYFGRCPQCGGVDFNVELYELKEVNKK